MIQALTERSRKRPVLTVCTNSALGYRILGRWVWGGIGAGHWCRIALRANIILRDCQITLGRKSGNGTVPTCLWIILVLAPAWAVGGS